MDVLLSLVGLTLIFLGIAGSVLPVLPGPLTGWFGLLLLHMTSWVPMDRTLLVITLALALVIFILDYLIPAIGAKRYGGSRYGAMGATIGLIVGLFLPIPLGFVIGAFFGAFIGELIRQKDDLRRAWRAALGSFLGFLTSTGLKLIVSFLFMGIYIYKVVQYW